MCTRRGGGCWCCVQDGVIATPELRGTILPGITRKSIVELATRLGFQVKDREGAAHGTLWTSENVFLGFLSPKRETRVILTGSQHLPPDFLNPMLTRTSPVVPGGRASSVRRRVGVCR